MAPKPWVIVTPLHVSHVQATIRCSKKHGLQLRTRSVGHDFEGVSYISESESPFVIIDLANLRSVQVDVENEVAWVRSGAIMGELYYEIAQKSGTLAFPGALCHGVAFGRYISGEGYGLLFRKYEFIDANGRILKTENQWGKISKRHSNSPPLAIYFIQIPRRNVPFDHDINNEHHHPRRPELNGGRHFQHHALGHCNEMSFVESNLALGLLPNQNLEILLDRNYRVSFLVATPWFKTKSDYGIWSQLFEPEARGATLNFVAYGVAFPHQKGNLYKISYNIRWREEDNSFVSKSPREAYVNYRDLDIGKNNEDGYTTYAQMSTWGRKYFKNNFDRLVKIKTKIDPENFFRHEQSISPYFG
ncbi:hypothetical protein V6Z12_D09G229500 [Gossypium hirsutum]